MIGILGSILPLMWFKWMILVPIGLFMVMMTCYYKTIMTHPGSPNGMVDEMENGLNQEFISLQVKRNGRVINADFIVLAAVLFKM